MVARIEVVRDAPRMGRKNRSPKHSFVLKPALFQVQPAFIAPVWPGETMKYGLLQSRAVSDPLKHKLMGLWHEYYIFYVKLHDLTDREDIVAGLMDASGQVMLPASAPSHVHYYNGKGINWTQRCLERVIDEYFRDEGEAVLGGIYERDGLPLAAVNNDTWLDSAKLESVLAVGGNDHELPGENPHIPDHVPPGFENHFEQWERMTAMQMTEASFEDWLKAFGVKPPEKFNTEQLYRPELLRYIREWTYPTNTVDPTTGTPTSAAVWSIAERLDKKRYFKEPGFIFGVTVTRPKVYMGRQYSAAAHLMQDAFSWLPAVLRDQPFTSLKESSNAEGPLAHPAGTAGFSPTEDYWVDIRDLAMHGDQFISAGAIGANDYASLVETTGALALPTASLNKRFASAAMADSLFVSGERNRVLIDGVFQPDIASTLSDTSL